MLVRALGLETRKVPTDLGWRRILGTWGGLPTVAGPTVSEASVLGISTVFACIKVYSYLTASLPLILYQKTGERARRRATDHPLYRVLHSLSNPQTTAFMARSFAVSSVLLRGNGLAVVDRNERDQVVALWPLRWDFVTVSRDDRTGVLVYEWHPQKADSQTFTESEVWHPIGLTQDGVLGLSPVAACKEAFGSAIASRDYASAFWKNGGTPRGILTHPETMGKTVDERDASVSRLRGQWDELYGGTEGAHRIAILEEGMKFEGISLNPQETQVLESRKFSRGEIASIFGVPPHIVGDLERATFGNIEQQSLELVIYHLTPFLTSLEQTIERDLLSEREREQGFYVKHTVDGLLRGDSTSRANYFRTAITTGWLSGNEVRELEDRDAVPGLDQYLVPLNMGAAPGDGVTPGTPIFPREPEPAPRRAEPAPAPVLRELEQRARAAPARPELARVFVPLLEDALGRLVRAEIRELKKKLGIHLEGRSSETMQIDLEDFYGEGSDFLALATKTLRPAVEALGRASFDRAATETPKEPDVSGLELFLAALVVGTVARYMIASRKGMVSLVQGEADGNAAELVRALFEKWATERPGRAAARESVQVSRASALEAFRRGGVLTKRWVTRGDNCGFCQVLDGETVSLSGVFLEAGQTIVGADGRSLTAKGRIGHAPLHRGCDCDVVPGEGA